MDGYHHGKYCLEAMCEACALYIPNDTAEYAIHTDASKFGIGCVLEQQLPDGSWAPCAFYQKKLEGEPRYGLNVEPLGRTGRSWCLFFAKKPFFSIIFSKMTD